MISQQRVLSVTVDPKFVSGRTRHVFRLVFGDHMRAAASQYVLWCHSEPKLALAAVLISCHSHRQHLQFAADELKKQKRARLHTLLHLPEGWAPQEQNQ